MKICSQLKKLNVRINSRDKTYLDAHRWKRIISQNISSLEIFSFYYSEIIDENFQMNFFYSLLNNFKTSFWIDRKWVFKVLAHENQLTYSVQPHR